MTVTDNEVSVSVVTSAEHGSGNSGDVTVTLDPAYGSGQWLVALPVWMSLKSDPPMGLRCGTLTEKEALHRKVLERHFRNALRFAFQQQRAALSSSGQLDIEKLIDHAVVGLLGFETENGLAGRYDPAYPAPPGLFAVLTQLMAGQDNSPPLLGEFEPYREPTSST